MIRCKPLLALLLTLSACTDPGPCRLAILADVPVKLEQNHLVVEATLNRQRSRLLFDTGAFTSVLTGQAVHRLGLRIERVPVRVIEGLGGRNYALMVAADNFSIANLDGRDFRFLASNIFGSASHIDGTLSTDFLSRYDIDLDIPAQRIGFYEPTGNCERPTVAMTGDVTTVPLLATDEDDQRPKIRVSIEGKPFRALIDTGAPHSVLFRPAANRLGLSVAALRADRAGRIGGIGPNPVVAYRHVLQTVTVGDLAIDNMPIIVADQPTIGDTAMILGLDFITQVHLWLSVSSGRVVMNYPPLPSPFDQGLAASRVPAPR